MERAAPRAVNNDVYRALGERWYAADDDPIALLRALARLHVPWIDARLGRPCRVLDVGCGGGITSNALAARGHDVVGVDLCPEALVVAARHDRTGRARYVVADALALPFADATFDAACAMDFLEHVADKEGVVREIARVLAPGGLFFFHTFNRNVASWLSVIKSVDWFVRNAPRDLHVLELFVKPTELRAACEAHGLVVREIHGCVPVRSLALLRVATTGIVPPDFAFRFTRRPVTGYSGVAEKASDGRQRQTPG
jgi:2-polyprenyl-6-hydroxyphenyl methylase/3-demethylubiquinone-9 3-methyltransferase